MAELKTKARNAMPASNFGLPGKRKYPMPDKSHAGNAKARVSAAAAEGKATPAEKAQVNAKANGILGKK